MLEILSQDYLRTARAKGLPEHTVIIKHALRGGLAPVIAFLGPAFAGLLSGSFVVETIFQIPGLGRFYVQAAFNRDYTMILGTTVFISTLIVFFNLLSDVLAAWLNPRLRYQFK
jgi:oligopeptide transport system permease protein